MKNYMVLLCCTLLSFAVNSQEPADALRFAWTQPNGTARQQAIGGAMASLGGDLSALYVNPAGLGFYKTGDLVLSPAYLRTRNTSSYLGKSETDQRGTIGLGTTGVVTGTQFYEHGMGKRSQQKRTGAFGIALNQTAQFNSNLLYRGLNTRNSYSQRFLEEISGIGDANQVAQNFPFGSSLAFNTFWIDTIGINQGHPYRQDCFKNTAREVAVPSMNWHLDMADRSMINSISALRLASPLSSLIGPPRLPKPMPPWI
jgi:hypothetical protein